MSKTVADLAWAAGIIEGEGCITFGSRAGRVFLVLSVRNTDPKMTQRLAELFGGATQVASRGPHKWVSQWVCTGRSAMQVLTLVEPYMVTKRDQVELARAWAQTVRPARSGASRALPDHVHAERQHIAAQLRELRSRDLVKEAMS